MNRERKGCHIHSELVRAFSPCYAPVPGCDKFRLVLPMFSCRYVDEIQKLSRPFKYATPFPRGLSRVDVAERLRRQTANLIPSGCAGSNPVINVFFFSVGSSTSCFMWWLHRGGGVHCVPRFLTSPDGPLLMCPNETRQLGSGQRPASRRRSRCLFLGLHPSQPCPC